MSKYTQVHAKDCLPCCFYETCAVDGIMFSGEEQQQDIANKCKQGFVWKEDKVTMFKITELPDYIQSFLPHLIVKDEKKNGELQSESYYAFSPEMIRWVNENREAYSECPTILLTCDELSKASLYYNSCTSESVPGEESFVLRFAIRKVEYPLQLSILIYDYLTACNIEGINPGKVAIGGNRNAPFYMELPFHKKIESL